MRNRRFGRLAWDVSEIGFGMWAMGEWTGSNDEESIRALQAGVDAGCTFFDTAWSYGEGNSERLLGRLLKSNPTTKARIATKIAPKNRAWPPPPGTELGEVFPPDYIRESAERSLANLGVDAIDLLFFHVWQDEWADDERWQRAFEALRRQGMVKAVGVSVNRREPSNCLRTLRTGLIDAVEVTYNIFEQVAEDALFPTCAELDVAIVARIPFDEGALTGTLQADSHWPDGDFRNRYFRQDNLRQTLERVEALRPLVPDGTTMPQLALRFVLSNPHVSTVIPGMRSERRVLENFGASDLGPLPPALLGQLRAHRWDRPADAAFTTPRLPSE